MRGRGDDERRNTKPVRIPSLPPPTGALPVIRDGAGEPEGDDLAPRGDR